MLMIEPRPACCIRAKAYLEQREEGVLNVRRRLWGEDSMTFSGEFDRIKGAGINPRPKQLIPLWLGGNSEIAMMRAVQLADGWQPSIAPSEAEEKAAHFREQVRAAGRDPGKVGLENLIHCGTTVGGSRMSPERAAEIALIFRDAGYSHTCINTMDAGHRTLDDHLKFAAAWRQTAR